jgi:hypothetical protein
VRHHAIGPGESAIGSTAGNAIVLPVRGVSRRHALLTLGSDGLILEDLGSKNGTLANGVRIQRTRLEPGDEVRIGPVLLRLEAVDAADVDIAIPFRPGARPPIPGLPPDETTGATIAEDGGFALRVVEDVLARLAVRPEPDLAGGLGRLRRLLGARSAALFELTRSATVIHVSSGEVAELTLHRELQDFARTSAGSSTVAAPSRASPLSPARFRAGTRTASASRCGVSCASVPPRRSASCACSWAWPTSSAPGRSTRRAGRGRVCAASSSPRATSSATARP